MRKNILENKIVKRIINLLKEQDEEYYKISPKELLSMLELASYSSAVLKPKLFGGKKLYVTGNLDLSGKPIKTLGNIAYIDGTLDISNTNISSLEGVEVKGWVSDYGTPLDAMRIRREELKKLADAESRREDNEWGLDNPDIDMKGLAANVLFNHLVYKGDLDENEEEGADVYSIIPTKYGSYNNTYNFEVIGLKDREYLVGLYNDMYEAAIENTEQLLDDVGTEGLSSGLLENNLDRKQIRDEMEEFYEDDIRENPEIYFNPNDYELTDEQEERKEQLENYIYQMEDLKTEKKEELENTEDEDIITNLEREIEEIEENIEKAQDELDSIVPDEEPTEEMIEKMVRKMVRGRDEKDWLEELGRDLKDYVNMRGVAEDIVDIDGIGTMSGYNSSYEDVYIMGPDGTKHNFVIVRTN
jgi:hypothetical protein